MTAAQAAEKVGGMPQLDPSGFEPQLIWLAITFVTLYFLLPRIALPRIGEVIEERRDRIQRDIDEAERLNAETERAIAAYEQALAEARAKAHAIAQEARAALDAEVAEERGRVEAEIAERTAKAEARIASARDAAMAHVDEVAADTAAAILEKLIGARASPDEIRRAIGRMGAGE